MKALIITYYWPPAGGSGVQRWLYFVKYLRDFGVEPILFIPENAAYPILDEKLVNEVPEELEVHKVNIWEPMRFFGRNNKKTTAGFLPKKKGVIAKLLTYIRANFFIPDARKFWINPASHEILKYLANNKIDWIITTGPPHSVHLIGKAVKEQSHVKWLADFRDPWTDIDYFHHLPHTKSSLQKHKNLESQVLKMADVLTVVSEQMRKDYLKYNASTYSITNGFDGDILNRPVTFENDFRITHMGSINADRNAVIFWEAIRELVDENDDFKKKLQINLIGAIDKEVQVDIDKFNLNKYCQIQTYIPHQEVITALSDSHVLLLLVNQVPNARGIVTGKVFEYLQAKRPILAIAPTDGDLATIIGYTQSGKVVDFNDKKSLKANLSAYFDAFQRNELVVNSINIQDYHRKNLTEKLAGLLKKNT